MNEETTVISNMLAETPAYESETPMSRDESIFNCLSSILVDSSNYIMPEYTPFTVKTGKTPFTIHGFEFDDEKEVLTIIKIIDCHSDLELLQTWPKKTCSPTEIAKAFKQMAAVVDLAAKRKLPELDEADQATRFYEYLYKYCKQGSNPNITLAIWTTGEITKQGWKKNDLANFHSDVWDATRIAQAATANDNSLEIDFSDFGNGIDFLMDSKYFLDNSACGGAVLIGKIPGECLAKMYFEHRTSLLQQNVRAFLNLTGSVNKGILETAKTEPEKFLSYNNGIAATSSGVVLEEKAPGYYSLKRAKDFQIVNGGQTTATLMVAQKEKDADISSVEVPIKLTIVNTEDLDTLVPKISLYANSQNKVQNSDFESNNPWLVKLENISRTIEAGKDEESQGQRIKWYFERVRGQYNVDLRKEPTKARKDGFKALNPARTRFSKTDLAVVGMAWDLEPDISCLGPQKCFGHFAKRLAAAKNKFKEGVVLEPSDEDFRRLCCLLILRRSALKLIKDLAISPILSKACISSYAIAYLSHYLKNCLPWSEIWDRQEIPMTIMQALRITIRGVESSIIKTAKDKNKLPSEWAKNADCWEEVLNSGINFDVQKRNAVAWDKFSILDTIRTSNQAESDGIFFSITSKDWSDISMNLKRHHENSTYHGVAATMAKYVRSKKKPSDKQAKILAKSLLFIKDNELNKNVTNSLTDENWSLLKQIADSK